MTKNRLRIAEIALAVIGLFSFIFGIAKGAIEMLSLATTVSNLYQSGSQEQKIAVWLISWPWWAYLSLTALVVVCLAAISITANIRNNSSVAGSSERELRSALAAATKAKETAEKQRDEALVKLSAPPEPPGGWLPFKAQTPLEDKGNTAVHLRDDSRMQTMMLCQGGFRTIHWRGLQLRIDHLGLMNRMSGDYGHAARLKVVLQSEKGFQHQLATGGSIIRDQEQHVFIVPQDQHNVFFWNGAERSISHFGLHGDKYDHGVAFALRVVTINFMNTEIRIEGYFADWDIEGAQK